MLILPRLICLDRNSTWDNFNNVLLTFLEKQNCRKSAYLLLKKLIIFYYVSESAWMKARLFSREIQLYHTNFKFIAILCRVWQLYVLNNLFSVDWYVGSNGIVWKIFFFVSLQTVAPIHGIWAKFLLLLDQDTGPDHTEREATSPGKIFLLSNTRCIHKQCFSKRK